MPCFLRQKQDIYFDQELFRRTNISQIGSGLWPLPDFASWAYQPDMRSRTLLLPAYSAHLFTRVVAEYPINLMVWQSGLYATAHDHATML